jgi:hypothetical protein
MQYLCLVHQGDDRLAGMGTREQRAFEDALREYADSLRRAGHLVAGDLLEPGSAGVLVRVRGGRISVSSAPEAWSAETLSAFFLLDARDLNEAIQLATRNPSARSGPIEIRPVRPLLRAALDRPAVPPVGPERAT